MHAHPPPRQSKFRRAATSSGLHQALKPSAQTRRSPSGSAATIAVTSFNAIGPTTSPSRATNHWESIVSPRCPVRRSSPRRRVMARPNWPSCGRTRRCPRGLLLVRHRSGPHRGGRAALPDFRTSGLPDFPELPDQRVASHPISSRPDLVRRGLAVTAVSALESRGKVQASTSRPRRRRSRPQLPHTAAK